MNYAFLATAATAIFAIVNPLGNVSLFAGMTEGLPASQKKAIARNAIVTMAGVLLVFTLTGELIFRFFSITVNGLRIGGGLLLLLIAIEMLQGQRPQTKQTPEEREELFERESVAYVPLGVPLLAGPGAITTVILYSAGAPGEGEKLLLLPILLVICLATYGLLLLGDHIFQRLGRTGIRLIGRLMGLILAAIAVQFVLDGVLEFLPEARLAWEG